MGQGKAYHSGARDIILKVVTFFDKEKQNGTPIIPVKRALDRASEATGVSIRTLRNIKNEAKKQRSITPTPSTSSAKKVKLPTLKKKSNGTKMEPNTEIVMNLCMSCLCVDQSLQEIQSVDALNYYLDCIREVSLCDLPKSVRVCWQCEAMLRKTLNFREQLKNCYRILQKCTNEDQREYLTQLSMAPRLNMIINKPIDIPSECSNLTNTCNKAEYNDVIIKSEQQDADEINTDMIDVSIEYNPQNNETWNETNTMFEYEESSINSDENITDIQTEEQEYKVQMEQIEIKKPNKYTQDSSYENDTEIQKHPEYSEKREKVIGNVRKRRKTDKHYEKNIKVMETYISYNQQTLCKSTTNCNLQSRPLS